MRWDQINEHFWRRECGRYFICSSPVVISEPNRPSSIDSARNAFVAWFKAHAKAAAEIITLQHRESFEEAKADAAVHLRAHPDTPFIKDKTPEGDEDHATDSAEY